MVGFQIIGGGGSTEESGYGGYAKFEIWRAGSNRKTSGTSDPSPYFF